MKMIKPANRYMIPRRWYGRMMIFLLLILTSLVTNAQGIAVEKFEAAPEDLTANLKGTQVLDQNGDVCALIRIQTTQKGFTFDVGALGITKTDDNKTAEVWVYVPAGVKRISIRHPQLGSLINYYFPIEIQGARTYRMYLTTGQVQTIVHNAITQQYVMFSVTPPDALVELDGNFLDVKDGTATKRMAFGTYNYTVQAPLYHSVSDTVVVCDPKNKHVKTITLAPAFGYISVPANATLSGAKVFIDNEYKGTVPFRSERLKSGPHDVRIMQNKYAPAQQTVTVADNQTIEVAPVLAADFATLTLTTAAEAEIWINDQLRGKGSWTGDLSSGAYTIECRREGHRKTIKELAVTPSMTGQTITLDAPLPIYGTIDITSSPAGADIYIDNVKVGTSPMIIPECLIGSHTVSITKQGYSQFTQTINVAENTTTEVSATLQNGRPITITAADNAIIHIDGTSMGTSTFSGNLAYGKHTVYAELNGKRTDSKTIDVTMGSTAALPNVTLSFLENKTFTVKGVTFTMVAVEGGTFLMGATSEQGSKADDDEKPVHQVTLSSYYIGQTEVTQALWKAVMGNNPSFYEGDNKPVERVIWDDCQDFVIKLNQLTGKRFRLPTEAEWEYACRGGKKSRGYKYSGSNTIRKVAWYGRNSSHETHPVATKSPNELGIYDMSGNVYEWCQDWKGSYSSAAQTNPTGALSGTDRVNRGGSYYNFAKFCRSSYRSHNSPGYRDFDLGLRLVLSE
ncbi:MAG: SUMF1/EgtB/PvdO family nonheme iron enzyme [Prevotellaceae bacterium]|nr:SUMF1/EgtB/PvdO family nonheme iron enzyme [Prevotellaceae bacterium]MDY6199593.1 SUMF1/EgtB/PvdO family nonheme iron enzyme [Prevotella sp.]